MSPFSVAPMQHSFYSVDMEYPHRNFILPSNSRLAGRIAKIEKHTGMRLPAVLREFWNTVGCVSFVNLRSHRRVEFWNDKDICAAKGFCDGVRVDACDKEWMQHAIDEFDSYSEDAEDGQLDADSESCFTVAPDEPFNGGPALLHVISVRRNPENGFPRCAVVADVVSASIVTEKNGGLERTWSPHVATDGVVVNNVRFWRLPACVEKPNNQEQSY